MYTKIKTLQQAFTTDPEQWLGKSSYFDNLFSGVWGDKQEDGSYFIETDAEIFQHVLRYLRTGVLPVFYSMEKGHDFPLYQALLAEAKYFAIERLERWLCERTYLDAVKIHYLATESLDRVSYDEQRILKPTAGSKLDAVKIHFLATESSDRVSYDEQRILKYWDSSKFMDEGRFISITTGGNVETTIIPQKLQRNAFYCPKANHGKSNESYCKPSFNRVSNKGITELGGWKEEEELKWCIVHKEVVFNHEICVSAFLEDG